MAKLSLMKGDCLERINNMLDADLHINLMNAISEGRRKMMFAQVFFLRNLIHLLYFDFLLYKIDFVLINPCSKIS